MPAGQSGARLPMRRGACLVLGLAVMVVVCIFFPTSQTHAAKRLALVIGNNAYENVPALQKAVNDSEAISQELVNRYAARRRRQGVLPPQEQKVAALPANPQPIASFTRSNRGWMVHVSLPEAATQFGYRIGEKGKFTDAGLLDALDQRTGTRMQKTSYEMAPGQGKTTIYVTWRDKRGEQADIVPINFDPTAALADEQKKILDQFWTSWIALREYNGMLVYFTSS